MEEDTRGQEASFARGAKMQNALATCFFRSARDLLCNWSAAADFLGIGKYGKIHFLERAGVHSEIRTKSFALFIVSGEKCPASHKRQKKCSGRFTLLSILPNNLYNGLPLGK